MLLDTQSAVRMSSMLPAIKFSSAGVAALHAHTFCHGCSACSRCVCRRRPFLIRALENTLVKLILSLEFYDAAGRQKIAIGVAQSPARCSSARRICGLFP